MSNTKHTPGPWKVVTSYEPTGIDFIIESSDEPFIARVQDWNYVDENDGRYHAEANAKLIAAAPELLRVLFDLSENVKTLEDVRNLPIMKRILSQADEVIKKATE